MAAEIQVVVVLDSAPELPEPVDGHYSEVRCGRVGLQLVRLGLEWTLEITTPKSAGHVLAVPGDEMAEFLRLSRRGRHGDAWEELLQWARNDCGEVSVRQVGGVGMMRLVDVIDGHAELWDGIDGRQPSAPGAVLRRSSGSYSRDCIHLFAKVTQGHES
jgi:hypothetical protein